MEFRYAQSQKSGSLLLIVATFFLAFTLEFFPYPEAIVQIKPSFPLLALVYWVYQQPHRVNYVVGFAIGLLLDLAQQTPFGFNTMGCSLIVFFTNTWQGRFSLLGPLGQAFHVFFILAIGQLCVWGLSLLESEPRLAAFKWELFIPSMLAGLLWLLMPLLVRYLRKWLSRGGDDDLF